MAIQLVAAMGGSMMATIDAVMECLRLLWQRAEEPSAWEENRLAIRETDIAARLTQIPPEALEQIVQSCGALREHGSLKFTLADLAWGSLMNRLLPGARSHDLRYLALRSTRRIYGVSPSSNTLQQMHAYSREIRALLEFYGERNKVPAEFPRRDFMTALRGASKNPSKEEILYAYLEAGRILGVLNPTSDIASIAVSSEAGKPQYVLSHLFGLPTSIRGFDDLFGGGGLMLPDDNTSSAENRGQPVKQAIGSRIVLAIGPFGSGKSLLSLAMAVEVARKGGVAWVMALEQSEDECMYALEAIGISIPDESFDVIRGSGHAFMAFTAPAPTKGCLLFLKPEEESWSDFITAAIGKLSFMRSYSLRMLVIDPVDAFVLDKTATKRDFDSRIETRKLFEAAKTERVNIWVTSERPQGREIPEDSVENIADTVIRLGIESDPDFQRRFIQITKSRLQEEQPGHHALTIESANGIRVDVASSSPRRLRPPPVRDLEPTPALKFGVPGMDELLGTQLLQAGDIVALVGPGKSKTLLGAEFLRCYSGGSLPPRRAVFISDYSPERISRFFSRIFPEKSSAEIRPLRQVKLCSISPGYVDSGRVLQDIQDVLDKCIAEGEPADRVLITNLARWEQEMPLVARDSTFGVALTNLLRQYGVMTVIVCGDEATRGASRLRDAIFDTADFLIDFTRVESRGAERTFMRAVKTRFMQHARIAFELLVEEQGLSAVAAPMLNVRSDGLTRPVRIRLFLHSETDNHRRYNRRLAGALRTSVSPRTRIARQTEHYDPTILGMKRLSAVDELQIIQLDEFQLPHSADILSAFPINRADDLLKDRLPELLRNVAGPDGKTFIAVPFYENISFLAHRIDLPASWQELANLCEDREPTLKEKEVVFSCPVFDEAVETYSCFFLEILQNLIPPPGKSDCTLLAWLSDPGAIEAAMLFRTLCHRAHAIGYKSDDKPVAEVSRHWYNTLNQELADSEPGARSSVRVSALYGNVTTAGEWYLGVPAYSASPDVGLEIIRNLTTPAREMERLYLGVGLPTRLNFYDEGPSNQAATSRYFRFPHEELRNLVNRALRRSNFDYYQQFSTTLGSHLLWLVEISGKSKDAAVRNEVELMMASLVSSMRFLHQSLASRNSGAER